MTRSRLQLLQQLDARSRQRIIVFEERNSSNSQITAAPSLVRLYSNKLPLLPPNDVKLELDQLDGVLGGTIWPSANVLCLHLLNKYYYDSRDLRRKLSSKMNVVELGSGTGAVGLFASGLRIFNSVHVTEHRPSIAAVMSSVAYNVDGTLDLQGEDKRSDRLLRLLRTNIDLNHEKVMMNSEGGRTTSSANDDILSTSSWPPQVHELDFTNPGHTKQLLLSLKRNLPTRFGRDDVGFDLILASDVTYMSQLHAPLARTISDLLLKQPVIEAGDHKSDGRQLQSLPKCLIAHQRRIVNPFSFVAEKYDDDYQLSSLKDALDRIGYHGERRLRFSQRATSAAF